MVGLIQFYLSGIISSILFRRLQILSFNKKILETDWQKSNFDFKHLILNKPLLLSIYLLFIFDRKNPAFDRQDLIIDCNLSIFNRQNPKNVEQNPIVTRWIFKSVRQHSNFDRQHSKIDRHLLIIDPHCMVKNAIDVPIDHSLTNRYQPIDSRLTPIDTIINYIFKQNKNSQNE